jgi:hypothetical protein
MAARESTPYFLSASATVPAHRLPEGGIVRYYGRLYTIDAADGYAYTEVGSSGERTSSVWSAKPPLAGTKLAGPVIPCYRIRRHESERAEDHPRYADKTTPGVSEHLLQPIVALSSIETCGPAQGRASAPAPQGHKTPGGEPPSGTAGPERAAGPES